MIISEYSNNLIVTDNLLTNLPISRLSSIPTDVDGLQPTDMILISKLCDPSKMTDTGYMSYKVSMSEVSNFAYSALGIEYIKQDISRISSDLDSLLVYKDMLENMTRDQSAVVSVYDASGHFNPLMISSIHAVSGVLLNDLSGYRLDGALNNVFNWRKFDRINATNGIFDNLTATYGNITSLTVNNINGQKYKDMSYAMTESRYQSIAKAANTFYFTYPD